MAYCGEQGKRVAFLIVPARQAAGCFIYPRRHAAQKRRGAFSWPHRGHFAIEVGPPFTPLISLLTPQADWLAFSSADDLVAAFGKPAGAW